MPSPSAAILEVAEDFLPIIHLVFANPKMWLTPEEGVGRRQSLQVGAILSQASFDFLFHVSGHSCGERAWTSCRKVRRSLVFMFHLPIATVWRNRRLGA